MLGLMIIFAIISLLAGASAMTGVPSAAALKLSSFVFASLFVLGLLTYAIRGRAR